MSFTPNANPAHAIHQAGARTLARRSPVADRRRRLSRSPVPGAQWNVHYGDYSTGKIWGARHDGTKVVHHEELADSALQLVYFNENRRGELLLMDYQSNDKGGLYTLEPAPVEKDIPPFPKTLSETGLFKNVAGHELVEAFLPYDVNVPFWSDGAVKHRWFAVPGADTTIEATREGGWKFPTTPWS